MASGIKLSEEAYDDFCKMKMGKKHRYMFMQIEGKFVVKKSMTLKSDDQRVDFENLLTCLPKETSCYVILDLTLPSPSGQNAGRDQLFVISWCPDCAVVGNRMLYSTTKQAVVDKIKEGVKLVQANDLGDLIYEEFLAK